MRSLVIRRDRTQTRATDSGSAPQSAGFGTAPANDGQKGQSLLEFALVAPLFFILLCALFDFGHAFYVQMTLQNAVRQAGRFAVTGAHSPDPHHPGNSLSRADSIVEAAKNAAPGLDVSAIEIKSRLGGSGSAGGPGDTVTVSVTEDLRLITPFIGQLFGPDGTYRFTVSASFKNEPFDAGDED